MKDLTYIEIICPQCSKLACFNEPFLFVTTFPKEETRPWHQWGGWFVVEKYPSLLHWVPPKKTSSQYLRGGGGSAPGYPLLTRGVVLCEHCHINCVHNLSWPKDAWWQWEIRGKLLYAWDRKHALQILGYIAKKQRPYRWFYGPLGRIPSHFLSAKNRELVVSKIRQSLGDKPEIPF